MPSSKAESSQSKKPKTDEEAALTVEPRDAAVASQPDENPEEDGSRFIGEQVPDDEARRRWPHRYTGKSTGKKIVGSERLKLNINSEEIIQARCHYTMAEVNRSVVFNLVDEAHVKDDNPLDCLIKRVRIVRLPSKVDLLARHGAISECDYYCDTKYLVPYSSFVNLPLDNVVSGSESDSTVSSDSDVAVAGGGTEESSKQDDDDCPNEQSDDDDGSDDSKYLKLKKFWPFVMGNQKGGDVDVICGGPPCQGISGFNRFRNKNDPLQDPKNKQLTVFMDFVKYLKPRFVLMENVVDMLKFAGGFLGRYALGRLVGMNYQARLGIMAAGAYGLPQFRMRKLPQYPLPTHNVVLRGSGPTEFEGNVVAYEEGRRAELEKELFLKDAISDLPPVKNDEARDELPYHSEAMTEFQQFIRLGKDVRPEPLKLFDHRPLQLNVDDYQRVCQIPKRKGANFRHLEGVRVCDDKKVEWDPDVKRVYLASGKPLVPDYAMTYVDGYSSKPFGRLWWDETVPTVVTRAEPHNQVHSSRECGCCSSFSGTRICPALAAQGLSGEEPVFALPEKFPRLQTDSLPAVEDFV
ncbi:hypothetical protein C3L33_05784, partial [Rhododendron williamsianum]